MWVRTERTTSHTSCTSIGCYERTLALLLEKYAGALPTWLMPTQAMIIQISEKHHDYAQKVLEKLQAAGIRVEADWRSEKMGYKIREAQLKKIPYMLVVGEKEAETDSVSVRTRKGTDGGAMSVDEFVQMICEEIREKRRGCNRKSPFLPAKQEGRGIFLQSSDNFSN